MQFQIIIGEILGEIIIGIFRVVFEIIGNIVGEILVRGPGYLICRCFNSEIDPDGFCVLFVGLGAWILLISGVHFLSS